MKICVVAHYTIPHIGGLEIISFEQAKYLKKLGHDVTIVTGSLVGMPSNETIMGIKILRVDALNFMYKEFGIPYPIFSPIIIKVLLKEIRLSDICLIHSFGFMSSLIASLICVKEKKPYILFQQNPFVSYASIVLNGIEFINDHLVGKYVIRNAFRVIAISNFVKHYVESLVSRNVSVLYSGIDHKKFLPAFSKNKARKKLNLPTDMFIVLSVRRLVYKNSLELLIDTAHLYQKNPNVLFLIVGTGPDYDLLTRKVKELKLSNCKFIGAIQNDLLPIYYQSADVFILPSRVEGLGIAILEAMSSSLPVIATNNGGQVEIIRNSSGVVVDRIPSEIYKAINFFINHPRQKRIMGKNNRKIVKSEFTWEKHIVSLVDLFYEAIQH